MILRVGAYEGSNKANLLLLQQMGIYPEPEVRNRRPKMRSVALFVLAMMRMRYRPSLIWVLMVGD